MAITVYTDDYVERLFQYWYSHGSPSAKSLREIIEKDKSLWDGERCPSVATLAMWFEEKGFYSRKDLLDARVSDKIDDDLVALKVQALREQAALFRQIRVKAAQYLLDNEFDSSSSAVAAFIKSSQEERIALGMSRTIQKLAELDDDGLLKQVKELAARVSGDVLDAEDTPEEEEE